MTWARREGFSAFTRLCRLKLPGTSESPMATPTRSLFPRAPENPPAGSDSDGGNPRAPTTGAAENGGSSPADAAATRSSNSQFISSDSPAYGGSATPAPFSGATPGSPAPPANTSARTTTIFPSGISYPHPDPPSSMATGPRASLYSVPPRRSSSRGSSVVGERAFQLEHGAAEALETNRLKVAAVEQEVLQVVRELEDAQRARESGRTYRGRGGGELAAEEERLARKEGLLREK